MKGILWEMRSAMPPGVNQGSTIRRKLSNSEQATPWQLRVSRLTLVTDIVESMLTFHMSIQKKSKMKSPLCNSDLVVLPYKGMELQRRGVVWQGARKENSLLHSSHRLIVPPLDVVWVDLRIACHLTKNYYLLILIKLNSHSLVSNSRVLKYVNQPANQPFQSDTISWDFMIH